MGGEFCLYHIRAKKGKKKAFVERNLSLSYTRIEMQDEMCLGAACTHTCESLNTPHM